jgi:site-specific DNA-cytosine methylase
VVSLFSGIGGLDLALERWLGAVPVCFAESEPYRRAVLAKHWPDVPVLDDVAKVGRELAGAQIVAGGFPCQDISTMGPKTGMAGKRSGGGWAQFARVIEEVAPDVVAVENVAVLRTRGLAVVLDDLDDLGFDAAWCTVPAPAAIRRRRLFLLAVSNRRGCASEPPHGYTITGHSGTTLTDAMLLWYGVEMSEEPAWVLNPDFTEALLALPRGWTLLDDESASAALGMQSRQIKLF